MINPESLQDNCGSHLPTRQSFADSISILPGEAIPPMAVPRMLEKAG
jgi:hypothetical protein